MSGTGKPAPWVFWSNSGNFPVSANPWSGQPLALQPAGTFYTPDTRIAAEGLNFLFGNLSFDGQALQDWGGNGPAQNWTPEIAFNPVGSTSSWATNAVAWCHITECWMAIGFASGTGFNYTTAAISNGIDEGNNWTVVGASTFTSSGTPAFASCMEDVNVAGTLWGAGIDSSGNLTVRLLTGAGLGIAGSAWSTKYTDTVTSFVKLLAIGTNDIVVYGQVAGIKVAHSSNTGASFTTLTLPNSAIPSSFTQPLMAKTNDIGTQAMIIGPSTTVSTCHVWTSPDGTTWTDQGAPFGTQLVRGMCWGQDAGGAAWYAVTFDSGPGHINIWRSATGASWANIRTIFAGIGKPVDLEALGALMVMSLEDQVTPTGLSHQIWSSDGGVSWWTGQTYFSINEASSTGGWTPQQLAKGWTGFIMYNPVRMRISDQAGLPPVAL